MKKHFYLLVCLIIASCGENNQETNYAGFTNQANFNPNYTGQLDKSNLNFKGKIIAERKWEDRNGPNLALFTQEGPQIFVYHYSYPKNQPLLMRELKDNVFNCDFDVILEFEKESIQVTDLNEDNYGELTFIYKKGCTSDVSPLEMKLMTLEDGDKYAIRGTELLKFSEEEYGDVRNIDSNFKSAHSEILNNALKTWERFKNSKFN